jgi:hypothetical protein
LGLQSHLTTTPFADEFGIVIVLFHGQIGQNVQLTDIGRVDTGNRHGSGRLEMTQRAETGLVLDNHKWNFKLATQCGQPHDQFEWVHVVGNQNEFGLLFFYQGRHVLEPVLDLELGLDDLLASRDVLDALFLGSGSDGTVLVEQAKDGRTLVLVERLGELVNGGGDLETLVQDGALSLQPNVGWPFNETTQITILRTNVTTNAVVTGTGGKERIGRGLGGRRLGRLDRLFGRAALFCGSTLLLAGSLLLSRGRGTKNNVVRTLLEDDDAMP